MPYYSSNKEFS